MDDQQVGRARQQRLQRPRYGRDVAVRIWFARATENDRAETRQPEVDWVETWMLSGQDQGRPKAVRKERVGYRFQFNGFWPGPDDQPDIGDTQPSP